MQRTAVVKALAIVWGQGDAAACAHRPVAARRIAHGLGQFFGLLWGADVRKDQAPGAGVEQAGGRGRVVVPSAGQGQGTPRFNGAEGVGDVAEVKGRVLGIDYQPFETRPRP